MQNENQTRAEMSFDLSSMSIQLFASAPHEQSPIAAGIAHSANLFAVAPEVVAFPSSKDEMKSEIASTPTQMPPVTVEMGNSYQSLSTNDSHESVTEDPPFVPLWYLSYKTPLRLTMVCIIVVSSILFVFSGHRQADKPGMMNAANDAVWMEGSAISSSYCKTSCTSQCSSYFSVYGPLCCDWADGNQHASFKISRHPQ